MVTIEHDCGAADSTALIGQQMRKCLARQGMTGVATPRVGSRVIGQDRATISGG